MKLLYQFNNLLLILCVFFLPINILLNNIFLGGFIFTSFFIMLISKRKTFLEKLKINKGSLFFYALPFLITVFGLLYTDELKLALDDVVRAAPFFLLPIIAILLPQKFSMNYRNLGYSLVAGCFFVACYSWAEVMLALKTNNDSFSQFFTSRYFNHNLVKGLNLHATYVSLFVYASIGFLAHELKEVSSNIKKSLLLVIGALLFLFLLNLLSRNILVCFALFTTGYFVYARKWRLFLAAAVCVAVLAIISYNIKHNYLRDKLFRSLNLFEQKTQFSKKDDRFDRLAASYEIFLNKPLFGYGTAAESKHRIAVFKRNRDYVAYKEKYNAHNQFFEYLSTYGLLGAIVYFLFFVKLWKTVFMTRKVYFVYIAFAVTMLTITESIFERTQGIVFTSFLIALLLSINARSKNNHERTFSIS